MSRTVWSVAQGPRLPVLSADTRAAVCVVGGGIAGVAIAHELRRRGVDVVLLHDAATPGTGGETEHSTAQLVTALDRGYRDLLKVHRRELTALAAGSHAGAIDRAEFLVEREKIDCGFARVDGWLSADDPAALEEELSAARAAGVDVEWGERPLGGPTGSRRALRFLRQAQLDPVRFTSGLAAAAIATGARMFGNTRVTEIDSSDSPIVRTDGGATVSCDAVVVATNAPIAGSLALDAKQAAYRTYVIAARVARGTVPTALYWDTDDPFHYVRLCDAGADGELLLVGGEDHKTGQDAVADARYGCLEEWMRARFPTAGEVVRRWSGQVLETMDGLAYIGSVASPHVHVVTGDCGNGITHGLIASILVPDLIRGTPNPWAPVYDPQRFRLRAVGQLLRENANVASQFGRWLAPGDASDEDDIQPGSGAIVWRGLHKAAVYRDASGHTHALSATCPHLGCMVAWNPGEGTWDCPCHGSRFDPYGRVLNGPANRGLDTLEAKRA